MEKKSGLLDLKEDADGIPFVTIDGIRYPCTQTVRLDLKSLKIGENVTFNLAEGKVTLIYLTPKKKNGDGSFTAAKDLPKETPEGTTQPAPAEATPPPPVGKDIEAVIFGQSTVSLTATVNLANYESLKVSVSGPAIAAPLLRKYLSETLGTYGRNDAVTADAIDRYRKRVLAEVPA